MNLIEGNLATSHSEKTFREVFFSKSKENVDKRSA